MIKARVTNRGDIRTWSNDRGEGKLFSVDLLDEHGTEIRATFFRDAVDKFHPLVEPEGVYFFSNGKLKIANKKFSSIKNDYEITFDDRAHIERAQDGGAIAKQHFDFVPIARLASLPPDTTLDIIGLVKEVGEVVSITTKAGKEVEKRDLTLVDDSMASIGLTLWGDKAKQPSEMFENAILALKGAKLGDYNGRSMGTYNSTTMSVNPDIPEAARVRAWSDSGAAAAGITSLTERGGAGGASSAAASKVELRKTIASIHDEGLGRGDKGDIITVKAHITFVKKDVERPPWYPANPDADETGRKTFKKVSSTKENRVHQD
jgi:replication factor A1